MSGEGGSRKTDIGSVVWNWQLASEPKTRSSEAIEAEGKVENWKAIYLSINVNSKSDILFDMLLLLVSDCKLIESPFLETRAYELISMAFTRQTLNIVTKLSSLERVNISASLLHRVLELLMSYYELLMSQLHKVLSLFPASAKMKILKFHFFLLITRTLDELMPCSVPFPPCSFPFCFLFSYSIQHHSFVTSTKAAWTWLTTPVSRWFPFLSSFSYLFLFEKRGKLCCAVFSKMVESVYLPTFQRVEWKIFVILWATRLCRPTERGKGETGKWGEGIATAREEWWWWCGTMRKRIFWEQPLDNSERPFPFFTFLLSLIDFCRREWDGVATSNTFLHSVNNQQSLNRPACCLRCSRKL